MNTEPPTSGATEDNAVHNSAADNSATDNTAANISADYNGVAHNSASYDGAAADTADDNSADYNSAAMAYMAETLIAANRRRRRIRRAVMLLSLPLVLIALLLVGKILSMYVFAYQARASYAGGDFSASASSASDQEFLNWFEPYKAPFNVGTALAQAGDLPESRAKLEESLGLARGLEVCAVRVNLALVLEQMANAAAARGEASDATELFDEALKITQETPQDCRNEPSADPFGGGSLGDALDGLSERLQQGSPSPGESDGEPNEADPNQEESEGLSPEQLEELQEQLTQGAEERDDQKSQSEQPDGLDGDTPPDAETERPW